MQKAPKPIVPPIGMIMRGLDIYEFDTYPAIQPVATLCVKGFVIDKYYKTKLHDRPIYFTYTFNNTSIGEQNSNEGDASYSQALQMGKTYLISVIEDGYRPYYKTLKLTNDLLPDILPMDIKLRQPGLKDTLYNSVVRMDSTHFKIDSLSLFQLDTLLTHWPAWADDSADVKVYLTAHYFTSDSTKIAEQTQEAKDAQLKINLIKKRLFDGGIRFNYMFQKQEMRLSYEEGAYDRIDILIVEDY